MKESIDFFYKNYFYLFKVYGITLNTFQMMILKGKKIILPITPIKQVQTINRYSNFKIVSY
jgi:hypothetical protein